MDNIIIKAVNHSRHEHDLHLRQIGSFYLCNGCEHSGFGPRFSCLHGGCSFNLHEECCGIFTPLTIHPFLAGCNFSFSKSPPANTYCNACRRIVNGPYYYCTNARRTLHLHLSCSRLPMTITTDSGTHLTLKNRHEVRCLYSTCQNVNSGWSYYSSDGNSSYHVACWKDRQIQSNAIHQPPRNPTRPI